MPSLTAIRKYRLGIFAVAALGAGLSFIPLGRVPLFGTYQDMELARRVAVGVFGGVGVLTLGVPLRGRLRKPVVVISLVLAALLVAFALFRIVVLGKRALPTFAEDDPKASAFYEKACDAGAMDACAALGACYWTGTCGLKLNQERGFTLYKTACENGEMPACGQLGMCYEFGGCGLVKSGEKAVAYYEKACQGGEMSTCNNLGVCYHKGECGVAKDDARAADLYRKACKGGDSGGCHNLDLMRN